jgi:hypothetical protein
MALLLVTACTHSGDEPPRQAPPPPPPPPTHAAGKFEDSGVRVAVRTWNCDGLEGLWQVRVAISGAVTGETRGSLVLRQGAASEFRDEFPVRIAGLPATAEVDLNVRLDGAEIDVRGEAAARALFVRVRSPIAERLRIRRDPIAECR